MKSTIYHFFILITLLSLKTQAQTAAPTVPRRDSTRLPFAIADEKRLSDEDLANKKEGAYLTGVPELSSDPINGFGYGLEGELFFNGKRNDPFFAYTPYRSRLGLTLFNTTRNQREVNVNFDVPYIFNSKWRLRVEAAYEINPNLLYFGTTEQSLNKLQNPTTGVVYNQYSDYEKSLDQVTPYPSQPGQPYTNHYYNGYTKQEYILNISAERSYLDGKMRVLAGYEVAHLNITDFSGKDYTKAFNPQTGGEVTAPNAPTLIQQDAQAGRIVGLGQSWVTIAQVGVVYDTRDLETDPSRGIFAEVTNEFSNRALGSKFNFNKTFGQVKIYQKLLPDVFPKLVLAARFGMGYTAGNAPFFEYQDQWSSEGSIEGLGGPTTIRGYKQSRFLGRVMDFANLELRYRFAQADVLNQHIAFSGVPFIDAGGVWDNFSRINKFDNYRYSPGLGLRIAWNVNTILRFDYAVSKEDSQFFFNLGHAF